MIVVLASRHDRVATDLVAEWPEASLCSAEDLVRPGWTWPVTGPTHAATWVVDGAVVPDERVCGVFVRRSTVHPEELATTHPDDRGYLACELHAFLAHVLSRTNAWVVNPVDDVGAFGEAALRPECWMRAAEEGGIAVAPLRVRSQCPPEVERVTARCEVVAGQPIGAVSAILADAATSVCRRLGLRFATASFDEQSRLVALTGCAAPSAAARAALQRGFARRGAS